MHAALRRPRLQRRHRARPSALRGATGGQVRVFSVDFAGYSENFQPDDMRGHPRHAVRPRCRATTSAPTTHDIVLDSADLMDPGVRAAVLRARDLPIGIGDMDTSLYLLFRAIREQSTVALSGESADEVFGGYRWFHDPAGGQRRHLPLARRRGRPMRHRRRMLLGPELLRELDLAGYRPTATGRRWPRCRGCPARAGLERRMREICYLHLTRFVPILLDRKDRMSMAVGLEVRVPFCDHRLVEYVFNAPWAMKTFDGQEKSLLRAAAEDVLPRSVLERRKSPYPSTQDPSYEQALRVETARLLDRGNLAAAPLIDLDRIRGILEQPMSDDSPPGIRASLDGLLEFNQWIEDYQLEIKV